MIDSVSTAAPAALEPSAPAAAQGVATTAAASGRTTALGDPAAPGGSAAAQAQPSTRLLVEFDSGQGYVYRLVDTLTGRLLVELPRAQLDELKSNPAYTAGALLARSV